MKNISLTSEEIKTLDLALREVLELRASNLSMMESSIHPDDIKWNAEDIYYISTILSKIHTSSKEKKEKTK